MDAEEIEKLCGLEDRHWWYAERRWLLRRMLSDRPVSGWALDLGAAAGGNTRVLCQAGWRCVALDRDETAARLANGRGLRSLRADAAQLPLATSSLGLVVAFDVLEHIEDDVAVVREISRCLRPGGHLLVAVPTDMRLWSAHDTAVGHMRRYERPELLELVTDAGFERLEVRAWNVLLRPAVALRRRTTAGGSDLQDPSAIANTLLRTAVMAERLLPVARLPGVTLLLSAQKPR